MDTVDCSIRKNVSCIYRVMDCIDVLRSFPEYRLKIAVVFIKNVMTTLLMDTAKHNSMY